MSLFGFLNRINVAEPSTPTELEKSGIGFWWFNLRIQLGSVKATIKPFNGSKRHLIIGWVSLYAVVIAYLAVFSLALYLYIRQDPSNGLLAVGSIITGLFAFALVYTIFYTTEFWRRYIFWKPPPRQRWPTIVLSTLLAWLVLTVFFLLIGGLLVQLNALGKPAAGIDDEDRLLYFWDDLSWQLLDSVPGLKVPETIEWKQPSHELDNTGTGWFLVAFKIMVILPVLSVVAQLTQRPKTEQREHASGP